MSELYRAIAGSPITYLSSDISAAQTTISIADDSALPDAPNICTIGYGENLETIKYETKSNGVLQNVTRGIEGTPRAWPAGTEVARFFTAYDYNALIENFNSHLADYETHKVDYETHKTEIANKMKNFEIVASGSRSGIAVSIDLPINSTYLFLMGRDGAVYFIHRYGTGDIVVTPIVPFTSNLDFNISGDHLEIDLGNRGRHYVLVRLS